MRKLADLKQTGKQLGSNPGGKYADSAGNAYYAKMSKSEHHAKNEILAGKLYGLTGAPVIQAEPLDMGGGKLGTITPWQKVDLINRNDPAHVKEAQKHLAAHAWLSNWDAVGLEYDNQGIVNGKMTTLDPGGSLLFRAQGTPKGEAFGNSVGEWDTLRAPSNHQAHRIFGSMSPADMRRSAARVVSIPDEAIRATVHAHGPGTPEQKHKLAEKLLARKYDIAKRALES